MVAGTGDLSEVSRAGAGSEFAEVGVVLRGYAPDRAGTPEKC